MQRHTKSPTTAWEAIRIVALTIFVVLGIVSHHAGYAAQSDSHVHTAHTEVDAVAHCLDEPCSSHDDGPVGCCASGPCGAPLPAPECASAPVAQASAYSRNPFEIAPRWNNRGVERPPKAA